MTAPYQPVTWSEWSYELTPDHFPDGCLIVSDINGKHRATGRCAGGWKVVNELLFTPRCKGCDTIIDNGVCAGCEVVFIESLAPERVEEKPLGEGWNRWAA